jgi:DNA-binding NarL/FixJ family response regulator
MGDDTYTATGENRIKVLVVDDHPVVRQGLKLLINLEPDFMVCAEAEDESTALSALQTFNPDIAVIDLSLINCDGIKLIKDIKRRYPHLQILVLSMHDESFYAEKALHAGASGYIMKQEAPEKIIKAIRHILDGNIYLSERMCSKMLNKFLNSNREGTSSAIECLSDREIEVYRLIGNGLTTREIAGQLNLKITTIETFRANIKNKLKLRNAAELTQHAIHFILSNYLL